MKRYNEKYKELMKEFEKMDEKQVVEQINKIIRKGEIEKYMIQCEDCEEYFFEVYNYKGKLLCEICLKKREFSENKIKEHIDTGRRIE